MATTLGDDLRAFFEGEALTLIPSAESTCIGLLAPALDFADFDPFDFFELLLTVTEFFVDGCEVGYMGGMWRGGG